MKTLISILLVLFSSSLFANGFEWIKKQNNLTNTNQLICEQNFKDLIKKNIPDKNIYLGMSNKDEESKLYDNFIKVLHGPPDEIKYYNGGQYIVATACRYHLCDEKGLIWIDTQNELLVGLILHYIYKNEGYNKNGDFLIFSNNFNNFQDIPSNFNTAVKNWMNDAQVNEPINRRFIGSEN